MPAVQLNLGKVPVDLEEKLAFVLAADKQITGKDPTPEGVEAARKKLGMSVQQ